MSYQQAPTTEDGGNPLNLFFPEKLMSFIKGPPGFKTKRGQGAENAKYQDATITFEMNPESWRFIAYTCFWFMVIFAMTMTEIFVKPKLLAGPSEDGDTCPPFSISKGGVDRTHGFDIKENSHLQEAFGFNNICVNWDYTPSREATAVVYVLFEYSLVFYLIIDFCLSAVSYAKGYVTDRYWKIVKIMFPIQIAFCALFRLIFVMLAYDTVRGHTSGFLLLQIALVTTSILNTYYIIETKVQYSFLGNHTKTVALVYIIGDVIISAFKIGFSAYIVFGWGLDEGNTYPPFAMTILFGDLTIGVVVDKVWMVFNAICPLIISYIRSRYEPALIFTLDIEKRIIEGETISVA